MPEVRHETQAFFGHLDTEEAKYPGLDYNHPTHRIRLCRWHWHARLFKAFDALSLTKSEVSGLTKWEGTKWAKDKYEKEQGSRILDTTSDGFPDWVEPEERPIYTERVPIARLRSILSLAPIVDLDDEDEEEEEESEVDDITYSSGRLASRAEEEQKEEQDNDMGEDSDEEIMESVGEELNQRLRDRVARLEAGETPEVMDEEWDQWFKNALESGDLAAFTEQMTEQMIRNSSNSSSSIPLPLGLVPPSMLNSARAGLWSEIPENLRSIIRRAIEADEANTNSHRYYYRDNTASWPRNFSDIHVPAENAAPNATRGVSPPGA